ncbi:MAG: DMT family transporter [Rhodospirillaceae bacterium]|nr:DMT family transporter [Rhodospirillaceae bacterium]
MLFFRPTYRQGVILVLFAGLCWSSMGLGIRFIETANVWQILFYRSLALAPFLFLIIAARSGGNPLPAIRKVGLAGIIGGLALVFAFTGGIFAIQGTTVANAMFLFAAAPFLAALLGLAILRERVRTATWWTMSLAMVGIATMVWEGISLGHMSGNIAALISALGFAVFTIALRWRKLDDMMPTVFLAGVFATIISAAVCQFAGYSLVLPAQDILIALSLGVFQVGAGMVIYTIGSRTVPAAELALLSMTEVVLGPFWVWMFLGETAGAYTLLGGAVLLTAIVGNALSGLRHKPTPIL